MFRVSHFFVLLRLGPSKKIQKKQKRFSFAIHKSALARTHARTLHRELFTRTRDRREQVENKNRSTFSTT